MSINHRFSSDHPQTLWWMDPTHPKKNPPSIHHKVQLYHHPLATVAAMRGQNAPFNFNLNQEKEEDEEPLLTDERENLSRDETLIIQKEAMFEKPLTPSDVGKLNRLVIPKQHAEKYFPLAANYGAGDSLDKALLLSFEDESGKSWRFRYSYWNSSQSYVLTKGWSRFVKEKRLDAGDVVMFERYREDGDRFFIGWRRRNAVAPVQDIMVPQAAAAAGGGGGGWTRVLYNSGHPSYPNGPPLPYQPDSCLHAGGGGGSAGVENQRRWSGNSKTVRLFGVNLECQSSQPDQNIDEPTPDASIHNYSNTDHTRPHVSNYYYNHMDMISFSGDHVNQNTRHSHQG